MKPQTAMRRFPELASLLEGADHIDMKTAVCPATLREFIVSMLAYQPGWVTLLYGVRAGLARILGMRQRGLPRAARLQPEDLPMQPGAKAGFFSVRMAQDEHYWVAEAADSPLSAAVGVVVDSLAHGQRQFFVLTIVHYRSWTGPVYFNIIRPFHHLVVGGMVRAGAKSYLRPEGVRYRATGRDSKDGFHGE
jgi:hypothetical protein